MENTNNSKRKIPTIFKSPIVYMVLLALLIFSIGFVSFVKLINNDIKVTTLGLKNIGELATQEAYVTEVNSTKSPRKIFGIEIPFTQSHYIYSYDFIIKAGFEVNEIIPDINFDTKTVTFTLPEPKVLSVEPVLDSFKLFLEDESIFNQIHLDENNAALIEMKKTAIEHAVANGLLESAKSNAESVLKAFFSNEFSIAEYSYKFIYN